MEAAQRVIAGLRTKFMSEKFFFGLRHFEAATAIDSVGSFIFKQRARLPRDQ
jgi:hypothetical protein